MNQHHAELVEAEQDQHDLEAELSEREAELSGHEERLLEQLQQFEQRNSALLAFLGYVRDEEHALLRRAEVLGPAAVARVEEALSGAQAVASLALAPDNLIESRFEVLTRRRELFAMRLELMDAREQLHATCVDHFEALEADVTGLEAALVRRQQALGGAARAIFMGAALGDPNPPSAVRARPLSFSKPPQAEPPQPVWAHFVEPQTGPVAERVSRPSDAGANAEGPGRPASGAVLRDVPAVRAQGPIELAPDLGIVAILPASVPDAVSTRPEGPATPVSAGAPPDSARPRLAPIRVTLDVPLEAGSGSWFFVEPGHRPDDLPGVFVATPNLLKVDREVRVRLSRGGARLELNARVAWRESQDPTGMGVVLTDVSAAERVTLSRWIAELPPRGRPAQPHP
jgi:hypothetical protein